MRGYYSLLRLIPDILLAPLLDLHFQPAFFREGHVFLFHVFGSSVCEFVGPQVDLVADESQNCEDHEEDYEGEERGCFCHVGDRWCEMVVIVVVVVVVVVVESLGFVYRCAKGWAVSMGAVLSGVAGSRITWNWQQKYRG